MPFTNTPDTIAASLTDAGRNALARMAAGEISFKATGFAVGQGGYLESSPVNIYPVQPGNTELDYQCFPTTGQRPITDFEFPYPYTCVINCRLASTDAIAGLGEIGIWGTILNSPADPAEVGSTFLMAIGHFPLSTKTLRQVVVYRVIIQF